MAICSHDGKTESNLAYLVFMTVAPESQCNHCTSLYHYLLLCCMVGLIYIYADAQNVSTRCCTVAQKRTTCGIAGHEHKLRLETQWFGLESSSSAVAQRMERNSCCLSEQPPRTEKSAKFERLAHLASEKEKTNTGRCRAFICDPPI